MHARPRSRCARMHVPTRFPPLSTTPVLRFWQGILLSLPLHPPLCWQGILLSARVQSTPPLFGLQALPGPGPWAQDAPRPRCPASTSGVFRPGPARLGPDRPGLARPGPARPGPARSPPEKNSEIKARRETGDRRLPRCVRRYAAPGIAAAHGLLWLWRPRSGSTWVQTRMCCIQGPRTTPPCRQQHAHADSAPASACTRLVHMRASMRARTARRRADAGACPGSAALAQHVLRRGTRKHKHTK
jgi:hypothetical protein